MLVSVFVDEPCGDKEADNSHCEDDGKITKIDFGHQVRP